MSAPPTTESMIGSKTRVSESAHMPPTIVDVSFGVNKRSAPIWSFHIGKSVRERFPRSDPGSVEPFRSYRLVIRSAAAIGESALRRRRLSRGFEDSLQPLSCLFEVRRESEAAGAVHRTARGIEGRMPSLTLRCSGVRSATPQAHVSICRSTSHPGEVFVLHEVRAGDREIQGQGESQVSQLQMVY